MAHLDDKDLKHFVLAYLELHSMHLIFTPRGPSLEQMVDHLMRDPKFLKFVSDIYDLGYDTAARDYY